MKKYFVSFLSIGFISATCIFVSCSKKKDDPAPVATTTSGTTTTGTTTTGTSGTTTTGTTSGTSSGSTTNSNNSGTGSFNDGTERSNLRAIGFDSPSDPNTLVLNISQNTSDGLPVVIISLKKPVSTGIITNAAGSSIGISYSTGSDDYYHSSNSGGSYSINITTSTSTQIAGTFTLVGKSISGGTKNVTGSFNIALEPSTTGGSSTSGTTTGTTTSSTTSGSTTSTATTYATGTGSYNDGTNSSSTATAIVIRNNTTSIDIRNGSSGYPDVYFYNIPVVTNQTGTFTNANGIVAQVQYSATAEGTWSTQIGGTCSVTVTTNSSTQIIGTYIFNGKNFDGTFKNVTGSFNISL